MMTIKLQDSPRDCISDHDVAALAEWAAKQKYLQGSTQRPHAGMSKAFAMIREGADLLLRYRKLLREEKEE